MNVEEITEGKLVFLYFLIRKKQKIKGDLLIKVSYEVF
ncbi:hypothetical protein CNEO3_1190015 [Clostridium neonatale]|uniref:Uncharacterized protein n=1 Tax=Clostridium neonatale TaxID=137838 RepID=A0AAD1YJ38_9CLOT|nr:hypothetical protein CNEO2_1300010 [Clostridium neonatale]CAI3214072.1 hypothetical protein CNEO2_960015 [Clostridium neonatale]CAI3216173.1 hypothetical protein CNEO2_960010 [Clostridium neonatale]CAI3216693.1 hypothetical protein CNEO2_1030010 [Clostridium neonatale]CAI3558235.1 hypothetical protein CNEO2_1070010 [Clostridium neonatale]